jgi:hypothetical protein
MSVDCFEPAYEGSTIMWLAGNYLRVDTQQYLKKREVSAALLRYP